MTTKRGYIYIKARFTSAFPTSYFFFFFFPPYPKTNKTKNEIILILIILRCGFPRQEEKHGRENFVLRALD